MTRFVAPRPAAGRGRNTLSLGPAPKPRNPFVAAAHQRRAGGHAQGDARQRGRRELHEALAELLRHSP
ncbi:MAG: hypothetical protein JO224_04385 [Pelomonas sp.]|nr:hypothetical protein [Roseateles sp.]